MKHVTYSGKSVLMGDDVADLLIEYASLLPQADLGDAVTVRAIGPDGNLTEVSFLLNASTELVTETAEANLTAPDNDVPVSYLRERIASIRTPPFVTPDPDPETEQLDDEV